MLLTIIATVVAESSSSTAMSDPANTAENPKQPVETNNNNDGGGGGGGYNEGGGETDMQMDGSSSNNNDQSKMTYSYQPRTINNNNIPELEEEFKRMRNHMHIHKKSLEDMDDDFITSFQTTKRSIANAKAEFSKKVAGLKEYGLTDEAFTTVTQVFNSNVTEPDKVQSQQRLINFAYANMNQMSATEKKLEELRGEKRKADDEIALLKKNAAAFEANKKSKPNSNYNAYQTYETDVSPKPTYNNNNNNNNNKPAQSNASSNGNGGIYDLMATNTKTTYEFPNATFNEKWTQKEVLQVTQDVNSVYLSSSAQNLFDLAKISHNNLKRHV